MALHQTSDPSYIYRDNALPDLTSAAEQFTIMMWVKVPAAVFGYLYSVVNTGNLTVYTTGYVDAGTEVHLEWRGVSILNHVGLSAGWHHIAYTYDGVDLSSYIDGVFIETGTKSNEFDVCDRLLVGVNAAGENPQVVEGFAAYKDWLSVLTESQILLESQYYLPVAPNCNVCSPFRTLDEIDLDVRGNATWQNTGTFEEVVGPDISFSFAIPAVIAIPRDIAVNVFDAVDSAENLTSNKYALSTAINFLTWTTSYGSTPVAATINLQASLDGDEFVTIDSSSNVAGETRRVNVAYPFIRVKMGTIDADVPTTVVLLGTHRKLQWL